MGKVNRFESFALFDFRRSPIPLTGLSTRRNIPVEPRCESVRQLQFDNAGSTVCWFDNGADP